MKIVNQLLCFTLILSSALAYAANDRGEQNNPSCAEQLNTPAEEAKPAEPTIEVTPVWNEPHRKQFKRIGAVNGILVETIATYFKKNKKFPLEYQLINQLKKAISSRDLKNTAGGKNTENKLAQIQINGMKAYFQMDGAAPSMLALYKLSVSELEDIYGPFRLKIAKEIAKQFATRLQVPSFADLAEHFGLVKEHLKIVVGDPIEFMKFAEEENRVEFLRAKQRMAKIFLENMRQSDRAPRLRTRSTTPDIEALFESIPRMKGADALVADIQAGDFTIKDLKELLGISKPKKSDFIRPVLFSGGIADLENYTRKIQPTAFQGHLDSRYFNAERQQQLVSAIEKSRGIITCTFGAGFPIEEQQLETMLAYAKDRDFVIVLFPELGMLDNVDDRFLNDDRIFVLTHTIQNKALRLFNIPIGAKQMNPAASVDLVRNRVTGQTTILGSPQQMMVATPRSGNDLADTTIWSPGSLSVGLYPSRLAIQGRTAELAEGRHINGFLVHEKANADAGVLGLGATNIWHTRNVEVSLEKEDPKQPKSKTVGAYFNDNGSFYGFNSNGLIQMKKGAKVLVLGDLHDAVTMQAIMPHLRKFIIENPQLEAIVLHDPIDGESHSRHDKDRLNTLYKKFREGKLDIMGEYLKLVQTVNEFLLLNKNLRVVMVDSNHSYWGNNLIQNTDNLHQVLNAEFVAELKHALVREANPFRDPLHYVFDPMGRELTLSMKENFDPELLNATPGANARVVDPSRVQVLAFGEKVTVGSADRPVDIHNHGHLGANGAKGSLRAHAASGGNSIAGDSHRPAIYLDFMNVPTLTKKKLGYNDAGYSAWAQGWGLIYEDGTKQLMLYNSLSNTFMQDPAKPILEGKDFFGDDPLIVIPNSNELLNGVYKVDQYSPPRDQSLDDSEGRSRQ